MPASRRPLAAAAVATVLGVGSVLLAARFGWLGPDVGRGSAFCEAAREGWIRQPANTASNLAFVLAGLAIGRYAARGRPLGPTLAAHPGLVTAYAVVVVLLGPASAAMHATQTAVGGRLDMLSMYLVAALASGLALLRLRRWGPRTFALWFGGVVLGCELIENLGLRMPLVHTGGNAVFAALLTLTVLVEVAVMIRGRTGRGQPQDVAFGLASLGAILLAFGIWTRSQTGSPHCDPTSIIQGHGIWHILGGCAAYLLFRHHAGEREKA